MRNGKRGNIPLSYAMRTNACVEVESNRQVKIHAEGAMIVSTLWSAVTNAWSIAIMDGG